MNVLIIGGSSDIGYDLAKKLTSKGYKVIASYNEHRINDSDIDYIKCDIRNEDSILNTFKSVFDKYGRIDILINMAAICLDNEFLLKTKKEFMDVLEVNLVGTFLTSKMYAKYIDDGMIINIASTDGVDTYNEYNMDYAASKAGVIHLSKNLRMVTNNKVICICPNWIDSNSTRNMDNDYLDNELLRIKQSRLLSIDEVNNGICEVIDSEYDSGSVIRIDIRDDKLWIEKI